MVTICENHLETIKRILSQSFLFSLEREIIREIYKVCKQNNCFYVVWVKHLMWLIGGPSTNQHSQGVWFALKSRANHDYDNMPKP